MNNKRTHIHSHIHNNIFSPDAAIFAEITDQVWREEFDLEILATRHLGNNLHIITSIPHLIYGYQRFDLVQVDEETETITELVHRSRNTSVRCVFNDITESRIQGAMDYLVEIGCSLDPYNANLMAIDLDTENSRTQIKDELNKLLKDGIISDWEYIID
jgi:hypothetical protein